MAKINIRSTCNGRNTEPRKLTPAPDELNLDNRAKAFADGLEKENTAINTILYSSYKQGWKDNHASFVALVEGRINSMKNHISNRINGEDKINDAISTHSIGVLSLLWEDIKTSTGLLSKIK